MKGMDGDEEYHRIKTKLEVVRYHRKEEIKPMPENAVHSFRDILVHARIERSDIQILTKLVEGLGHLGVVTTVDKAQGEVIIQTTSDCWPELERALRHMPVTVEVLEQSHSTNFGKYQTR